MKNDVTNIKKDNAAHGDGFEEGYVRIQRPEDLNIDGVLNLRAAVVEKACKDYTMALLGQKKDHATEIEKLEKFFTGDIFSLYCDLDGDIVMEQIRKNVKNGNFHFELES